MWQATASNSSRKRSTQGACAREQIGNTGKENGTKAFEINMKRVYKKSHHQEPSGFGTAFFGGGGAFRGGGAGRPSSMTKCGAGGGTAFGGSAATTAAGAGC